MSKLNPIFVAASAIPENDVNPQSQEQAVSKDLDAKVELEQQLNNRKAQISPDALCSYADLDGILDEYERERRSKLEEQLKLLSNSPRISSEQSVREYLHENRDWLKINAPKVFESIIEVNRREHEEIQKKGAFKAMNFDRANPVPLEIKDKNGNLLHSLEYKTDDKLVIAQVLKSIDRGPMHLSLALQDSDGDNIDADKAVFFNVSYGSDGKIRSMNYPEPLEFEGTPPNEKCMFRVDGRPYYLKVDKAILDELNSQLAQSKARAADVGMALDNDPEIVVAPPAAPAMPGINLKAIGQPLPANPQAGLAHLGPKKKDGDQAKVIVNPQENLNPTGLKLDNHGNFGFPPIGKAEPAQTKAQNHPPAPLIPPAPPLNNPPKPLSIPPTPPVAPKQQSKISGKVDMEGANNRPVDLQAAIAGLNKTGNLVNGKFAKDSKAHADPSFPDQSKKGNVNKQNIAAERIKAPTPKQHTDLPSANTPKAPVNPAHSTPNHHTKGPDGKWSTVKAGKTPKSFGNQDHNKLSVPPKGFDYMNKPLWHKDLAAKNAAKAAERLRSDTSVKSNNTISPSSAGEDSSKNNTKGRG